MVSEPRYPCFKFNAAMGFAQAAKLMVAVGLLRCLPRGARTGVDAAAGEPYTVLEPGPRDVNLRELFRARMAGPQRLRALLQAPQRCW